MLRISYPETVNALEMYLKNFQRDAKCQLIEKFTYQIFNKFYFKFIYQIKNKISRAIKIKAN